MRAATAASLYFAIVFGAGFLLGPIRVLWLEPRFGMTAAALCEAPLLLAAMILAARWVPGKVGLPLRLPLLATMGIGALVLQQFADFIVGIALRGLAPGEQLAHFMTPAGMIYGGLLLAFAAMPMLVHALWKPT